MVHNDDQNEICSLMNFIISPALTLLSMYGYVLLFILLILCVCECVYVCVLDTGLFFYDVLPYGMSHLSN